MLVTGCGLRVTGYGLRVTCCVLRVARYVLRVTGCALRVTGCALRVASYGLRVTGCAVPSCVARDTGHRSLVLGLLLVVNIRALVDNCKEIKTRFFDWGFRIWD